MCACYTDAGVFCEKCAEITANEKFVSTQTEQLDEEANPELDALLSTQPTPQAAPSSSSGGGWRMSIILVVSVVIYAILYVNLNPNLFTMDAETRARLAARDRLEDCRLVFEEIGTHLENGDMPDPSLRCAESFIPNIITRDNDSIRISHPNPDTYGFSEIYVTNETHEPIFVE